MADHYEEHDVDTERWFMSKVHDWNDTESDPVTTTREDTKGTQRLGMENVDISFGTIFFVFIDDSGSQYIPVVAAKSAMQLLLRNWSHSMDAKASFSIVATYYNARQCVWEPLIEPWYDAGSKERRYGGTSTLTSDVPPWTLRMEVCGRSRGFGDMASYVSMRSW